MNIRCFRCGWSFAMSRDSMAAALTNAAATGARHHDERCPRCRHVLKISLDQLRRAMPPGWTPPPPETQAATPSPVESPAQTVEAASPAPEPAAAQAAASVQPASASPAKRARRGSSRTPASKAGTASQSKTRKPAARATATRTKRKTSAK